MRRQWKRKLSVLLSAAMVLSAVNTGPLYASRDDEERTIVGFEELGEMYTLQTLPIGADEKDIKFPEELLVDVVVEVVEEVEDEDETTEAKETVEAEASTETEETAETEESTEAEETVEAEESTEAEETVEAEESAEAEETVEAEASTEAEETVEAEASTEAEETVDAEASTEAEETVEAEASTEAEETVDAEASTEAEETVDAEASTEAEEIAEAEESTEAEEIAEVEESTEAEESVEAEESTEAEESKEAEETVDAKKIVENESKSDDDEEEEDDFEIDFDSELENDLETTTDINESKQLTGIKWELNAEESTEPEFNSDVAGTYVFEPIIPSGYEVDSNAELPRIMVVVENLAKAGSVLTASEDELINALKNSNATTITVTSDITVAAAGETKNEVVLGASHTLIIPDGKTLTITGRINTHNATTGKTYELTIQGAGDVNIEGGSSDCLRGKITLGGAPDDSITVSLRPGKTRIRANALTVNNGATLLIDSSDGNILIEVAANTTLDVNDGGMVQIANFENSAITCEGVININQGGTISIDSSGAGNEKSVGINVGVSEKGVSGKLNVNGGTLTSTNGGSIYLSNGAKVEGMDGILSDAGKELAESGEVTVGAEDKLLTEGCYVGDGEKFVKGSLTTDLDENTGILTITETGGEGSGWGWSGGVLQIMANLKNCKQIKFASGIAAKIQINRGPVSIEAEEGMPAIFTDGDITITSTNDKGILTVKGSIQAKNVTISGIANVVADGKRLFDIADGNKLTLEGSSKLTSKGGGSIFLRKGAKVEGMAGVLSDQKKEFTSTGEVTVGAETEPAEENKLTAGEYVGDGEIFTKGGSGGEVPTLTTGLKDGVLTLASEGGGAEDKSWGWGSNTLNINEKLKDVKQIVFAPGITAKINLNRGNTIIGAEDSTEPAIIATEAITITSTWDEAKNGPGGKLTVIGSIEAENININGVAKVEANGKGEKPAIQAKNGTMKIGGTAKVTANGAIEAGGDVTIEDNASVDVKADKSKVGLSVRNGKFTVDGNATVDVEGTIETSDDVTIKGETSVSVTADKSKAGLFVSNGTLTVGENTKVAEGNNAKVVVDGAIEISGDVTINGNTNVSAFADKSRTGLCALNGTITVNDAAKVTARGSIDASGNILIAGNGSVVAEANTPTPALNVKAGTIILSGTTTVIARNENDAAMNPAPEYDVNGMRISVSKSFTGKPTVEYNADKISSYKYLKIDKILGREEIEEEVGKLGEEESPSLIDSLADQIKGLPTEDIEKLKPETIDKVDQLLQKVTGIKPVPNITAPEELKGNKKIKNVIIRGALLAADITSMDSSETVQVEIIIVQKQPEGKSVLTFECDLLVNGKEIDLKVPVEVKIILPPEFIPHNVSEIHYTVDGIDKKIPFEYEGDDNSTTFQTDSFSTFSLVKTSSSSGGSGGGGGGGTGGPSTKAGASVPGKEVGKWVQDATGWWFQKTDKSYPKDGWAQIRYGGKDQWYFFNKDGYMVTGWVLYNNNWYYMSTAADGTSGIMLTGWQTIDGKRYYFSEAIDGTVGVKLTNIRIGEYYLNNDGVAQ